MEPSNIRYWLVLCTNFLYTVIFTVIPVHSATIEPAPVQGIASDKQLDNSNSLCGSPVTQALCRKLETAGFANTTFKISNPEAFIAKHKLSSTISKKLSICFKQAEIKPEDIGTLAFCDKLESVGFRLIKKAGFADGKQHHSTVVAECPPSVGPFILKAEARLDYIKHNRHFNILRIVLAEAIKDYAKKNGLKLVKIPRKYLFHVPHSGKELTDKNFLVIAEKINLDTSKTMTDLSTEHITQLADLISALWLIDIRFYRTGHIASSNTFLDTKGRLVLLDTQPLCHLWTLDPIKDLRSKGFTPVPIEGIIANMLLEMGHRQNNDDYIFRGQLIMKTIYILYRELFYLYGIHRNNLDAKDFITSTILKCHHALDIALAEPFPAINKEEFLVKKEKYKAVWLQEYLATKYFPRKQIDLSTHSATKD